MKNDRYQDSISRRGFVSMASSILSGGIFLLAVPQTVQAEEIYGGSRSATISWYSGTASSRMSWQSGVYVAYHSSLSFSHSCEPGSVRCSLTIIDPPGTYAAINDYYNRARGKKFDASVFCYEPENYSGAFYGSGAWSIPDYAGFTVSSPSISCVVNSAQLVEITQESVSPSVHSCGGERLLPVVGASGKPGFIFAQSLEPFGGASTVEDLEEMVSRGFRSVDVYDESGDSIVDKFFIGCRYLDVIES